MTRHAILLVFLKYPEPGKVKTRLAAQIGDSAAAELYREWIGVVLQNVQAVRPNVHIVGFVDGAPTSTFAEWNSLVDEWLPQPAGDLGERLTAAFDWGFARGEPVLAIGTDCLELDSTHIEEAIDRLKEADAVFGPATDGGFYLVGMRRRVPGIFDGIRWSSPYTLADQLRRCQDLSLNAAALTEQLLDIDTLDDWRAYQRRRGESK